MGGAARKSFVVKFSSLLFNGPVMGSRNPVLNNPGRTTDTALTNDKNSLIKVCFNWVSGIS